MLYFSFLFFLTFTFILFYCYLFSLFSFSYIETKLKVLSLCSDATLSQIVKMSGECYNINYIQLSTRTALNLTVVLRKKTNKCYFFLSSKKNKVYFSHKEKKKIRIWTAVFAPSTDPTVANLANNELNRSQSKKYSKILNSFQSSYLSSSPWVSSSTSSIN